MIPLIVQDSLQCMLFCGEVEIRVWMAFDRAFRNEESGKSNGQRHGETIEEKRD